MDNYKNMQIGLVFNFSIKKRVRQTSFISNIPCLLQLLKNQKMGKQQNKLRKPIKDPQDHPISKSKTLLVNLNSYIRMLNKNFQDMPAKQYIRNIHRFIQKIKRKLKHTDQQKLIEARQKIKICKKCQGWSGKRPMIQCHLCQDYYHKVCLNNCPSTKQEQQYWFCESCDYNVNNKKSSKIQYLRNFNNEDECKKCQKQKKNYETFITCMKCNNKYHKNCHGKNAVCYKCHLNIEKQMKQNIKQSSLFDFNFQRKLQSSKKKKINSPSKGQGLKLFGKEEFVDENTQASTNPYPMFNKNFPQMTRQEIEQYKNGLIYAIRVKEMTHIQQLYPINCSLDDDNQQSLDFGLMHMNPLQYQIYKKYKTQPFGPYKFIYRQNMGYDVIADKDLPKGMLVCQYVGQVVPYRQIVNNASKGHNDSLFELRAGRNADQTLYIRPQGYTNMGRFINGVNNVTGTHKINVASIRMMAKGKPGIFLYTTRKIKKGQSLAYDYNAGGLNAYQTSDFV